MFSLLSLSRPYDRPSYIDRDMAVAVQGGGPCDPFGVAHASLPSKTASPDVPCFIKSYSVKLHCLLAARESFPREEETFLAHYRARCCLWINRRSVGPRCLTHCSRLRRAGTILRAMHPNRGTFTANVWWSSSGRFRYSYTLHDGC